MQVSERGEEKYMRNSDKSKGNRRLLCTAVVILVSAVLVSGTVYASERHRRDSVHSRGTIDYDNGKVVINGGDLVTLANEMDELEETYKAGIADALAQIGTYVQQDGSVNHESMGDIDPCGIKFGTFILGILQSQSVQHLKDIQASDTKGPVYYKYETNNILEVTREDTGMPVYIMPATAHNLTAQTAAWVDGRCLDGNGFDNYYFYQKGFIEGYAARVGAEVIYHYDDTGKIESAELIYPD